MCKNFDVDIPSTYSSGSVDSDYSEVMYSDEPIYDESNIYSSRTESSDGGDDDDN